MSSVTFQVWTSKKTPRFILSVIRILIHGRIQNTGGLLELNPRITELAAAFLSDLLAPLVDLFLGVGSLRLTEQPHHAQTTS